MTKHILITGSTDGIGQLAALAFAQKGHITYLHGRNHDKLQKVMAEIRRESQNDQIHGFVADFADLDAVRQMAASIGQDLPKLDVLINNAGVYHTPVETNKDGFDLRYVVNYFAPYILTNRLLPLLQKSDAPRIINLSSAAQAPLDWGILQGKKKGSAGQTYAQSKLALTMWSRQLAQTYPEITTIPLNPGSLLNTRMVREAFGKHWAPADKGADIIVELALGEGHQKMSGEYFDNDQGAYTHAHADAYDAQKIKRLIHETSERLD